MREFFCGFTSKKSFLLMLALIAIHVAVALPFKAWILIPLFADIRPVAGLIPVYGAFMGPIGGVANAFGNLIVDWISGMLTWGSAGGFLMNLLTPYLYGKLWERCIRRPFEVKIAQDMLTYGLISLLLMALHGGVITLCVATLEGTMLGALDLFYSILLNNFFFAMMVGLPLIILLQAEYGILCFADKKEKYMK